MPKLTDEEIEAQIAAYPPVEETTTQDFRDGIAEIERQLAGAVYIHGWICMSTTPANECVICKQHIRTLRLRIHLFTEIVALREAQEAR